MTRADKIMVGIARVVKGEPPLHVIVAATTVAVHEAMRAGLGREEFLASCERAWEKSLEIHGRCSSS